MERDDAERLNFRGRKSRARDHGREKQSGGGQSIRLQQSGKSMDTERENILREKIRSVTSRDPIQGW